MASTLRGAALAAPKIAPAIFLLFALCRVACHSIPVRASGVQRTEYFVNAPPAWVRELGPSAA
jgi:hypothetical protein